MRVLMLGWEFPPFISGGLGTACYGLTRALDRAGHRVTFVLPRAVDRSMASHVQLLSPEGGAPPAGSTAADRMEPARAQAPGVAREVASTGKPNAAPISAPSATQMGVQLPGFEHVTFLGLPTGAVAPSGYPGGVSTTGPDGRRTITVAALERMRRLGQWPTGVFEVVEDETHEALVTAFGGDPAGLGGGASHAAAGADYAGDVLSAAREYAVLVTRMCRDVPFDVIHAHDWMTYPAGMALARLTGKPLVTHIHSTEFDRSGEHVNQRIYDIERRGMHAAVNVIAVSQLTKSIVAARYAVDPQQVQVVYNGIEQDDGAVAPAVPRIESKDKIVLFLGRITMQKGPEYFVQAAKRVLEKLDNVKFLVAGDGNLARQMIEQAASLGIGHKLFFTGFLRGKDVARVFRMADCYVMPSVSEPFGIAPLEALSNDTPVIISKQSGVAEVLSHALKVDFWDTEEMANKIVAVLKHPPLSQTLRTHGALELRKLTWDGAATRCLEVYRSAMARMNGATPAPVMAG